MGVFALALLGGALGVWFSRLPKPWWLLGYLSPLLLVLLIGISHRFGPLQFVFPFSWLMAGRTEFALTALLTTMILITPLSRLPRKRDRFWVCVLLTIVVSQFAIGPFLAPALNRSYLASIQTQIDAKGVCRQSNDYSCGPAAAVTALRHLGFPAEEGELAILAHSSRLTGTETDVLRDALLERYGADGLVAEYRFFKSVSELKGKITIARIKAGILLDHYVTVMDVTDKHLLVADPFKGMRFLTHKKFESEWRFIGITLERRPPASEIPLTL